MSAKKKSRSKRQAGEEGPENSERWLLTYADMMTLLVAFFIMLYSMSVMNMKKFSAVAIAIRSGFGGMDGSRGDSLISQGRGIINTMEQVRSVVKTEGSVEGPLKTTAEEERYLLSIIREQLAALRLDRTIEPVVDIPANTGNRFRVVMSDRLFFEPGSAEVSDDVRGKLKTLAQSLKKGSYSLNVSGYSSPLGTNAPFADSWQLSAERARRAMTVLTSECGITPRRLTLNAHGEWGGYGASRKVSLSNLGEWHEQTGEKVSASLDRVVVWAVME